MSIIPQSPEGDAANFEFYRKRAKALLKEFRAGSSLAQSRFRAVLGEIIGVQLADAQLVVARESGFASWSRLKRQMESSDVPQPEILRVYEQDAEWYEERAEGFLRAYRGRMGSVFEVIRRYHPLFVAMGDADIWGSEFGLDDALLIQARQHGFGSWDGFARHIADLKSGKSQETFLLAFEAIKKGDVAALRLLIKEEPFLALARGSNGNTLLNLALSFRREDASEFLLDAGAPVNAGNNYGWTPLHQAAYSGHIPMMEKLIVAGGDPDLSARGEGGTPLVQALFWGSNDMAEALAKHSLEPRNLRVAAGLGRLDLLEECFDSQGDLAVQAIVAREFYRPHGEFPEWSAKDDRQEIMDEAFTYACRNGRTGVLGFLLEKGAGIGGEPYQGTGLIWASFKGRQDTVKWLVERGADINQQGNFGGRGHGVGVTALHLAVQGGEMEEVRFLVELGARADIEDGLYGATAVGWAEFFGFEEIAEYLRGVLPAG